MGFNWRLLNQNSWAVCEPDKRMLTWIRNAKNTAQQKLKVDGFDKTQLRCGGTWFVGANFLDNDSFGTLNKVRLEGMAIEAILERYGRLFCEWDRAQISICYPGYPKPSKQETAAAFSFRKNSFGAHVDGILPIGNPKRRYAKEYHAFIFGIPLEDYNQFAAPVVVWEGSHRIIRTFLSRVLLQNGVEKWKNLDITQIYAEARKEALSKCKKKIIHVPLGGCYVLHRLAVHGIMPWKKRGNSEAESRMVAYFRPILKDSQFWLDSFI